MKKFFFIHVTMFFALLIVFSSCQKSITESSTEAETKVPDASLKNKCQLTAMNLEGFNNRFHYNTKGLADEWKIEYGDGIYHDVYTLSYDNNNHLSRALYHYDGLLQAIIDFVWTGNRLTTERWDYSGFPFEVENIYDVKGQIIRREISYGFTAVNQYSPNGNILVRDILIGDELIHRGQYTYNQPNKNPFLAIQGLPYGFPFITFDFSPWWETSEKITEYSAGSPFVTLDEDPAQTVMHIGFQNYPAAVDHFDLVTNSLVLFSFEYQNCGPQGNQPTRINSPSASQPSLRSNTNANKLSLIKMGPPDAVKKQLEQLRKK
jgi:hypothetical protein